MILGIDLGTTHSAAAVFRDGAPVLIPNAHGDYLTPSAVSLDEQGHTLVGLAARERAGLHAQSTALAFKRWMGSDKALMLRTGPHEKSLRAEELSALVLQTLKADAEAFLGESVTEAVITVPAYFNEAQRRATRTAGEIAGLKVERLQALKRHPRDEQDNRYQIERAKRLFEDRLGNDRAMLQDWLAQFEAALQTQDARIIRSARQQFKEALDSIDTSFKF